MSIRGEKKAVNMSQIVQRETTASPQGTCVKIISEIEKYEKTFSSAFPREKRLTQGLLDQPSALQSFPIF